MSGARGWIGRPFAEARLGAARAAEFGTGPNFSCAMGFILTTKRQFNQFGIDE